MSIRLDPVSRREASVSGRGFELPTRKLYVRAARAFLFGIAPDKAFLAEPVTRLTGGLLHHHFTLTFRIKQKAVYFCGAGSALLQLPVRKYPALWCPDFPLS